MAENGNFVGAEVARAVIVQDEARRLKRLIFTSFADGVRHAHLGDVSNSCSYSRTFTDSICSLAEKKPKFQFKLNW